MKEGLWAFGSSTQICVDQYKTFVPTKVGL
jgi:hypothetical protein